MKFCRSISKVLKEKLISIISFASWRSISVAKTVIIQYSCTLWILQRDEKKAINLLDDTTRLLEDVHDLRYFDDLVKLLDGELERISRRNWPFILGHSNPREEMNLIIWLWSQRVVVDLCFMIMIWNIVATSRCRIKGFLREDNPFLHRYLLDIYVNDNGLFSSTFEFDVHKGKVLPLLSARWLKSLHENINSDD